MSRAAIEAAVILGRVTVGDALRDPTKAKAALFAHAGAVAIAVRELRQLLDDVPRAVAYAESLPAAVRLALAAAWAGDAGAEAIGELGLMEAER